MKLKDFWNKVFTRECLGRWDCVINRKNPYYLTSSKGVDCPYRDHCEKEARRRWKKVKCSKCGFTRSKREINIENQFEHFTCLRCKAEWEKAI